MSLALLYWLNLEDLVGDIVAPTVTGATINISGNSIAVEFSETVAVGVGGSGGFSLSTSGGSVGLEYASGSGTSTLNFTPARTISSTETLSLTYVNPGDGIEDAAGNDLESFSGQAVTNNSTVNSAPTDISISGSTVYTTAGVNAPVGTLSATDPDAGDTATFTLVAGTGDTDNASFNISGASLRANDPSALGASTRSVRIRATDSAANTYEEAFTITVSLPANVAVLSGRLQISTGIHI